MKNSKSTGSFRDDSIGSLVLTPISQNNSPLQQPSPLIIPSSTPSALKSPQTSTVFQGWVETPRDEEEFVANQLQIYSTPKQNNVYAIPLPSSSTPRSSRRSRASSRNSVTVRPTLSDKPKPTPVFVDIETSSNVSPFSLHDDEQSSTTDTPRHGAEFDSPLQTSSPEPRPIDQLSMTLLVHIFSFMSDQLDEKSDSEEEESDDGSDIEEEDTETALETAKNTLKNAYHSFDELAFEDEQHHVNTLTKKKKQGKRSRRDSSKYYSEFEIQEDEDLTTDWLSAGLGPKRPVDTEKIIGSATERINNLRRSISVPSISMMLSKNFTEPQSNDDNFVGSKSTLNTSLIEDGTKLVSSAKKVFRKSKKVAKKKAKDQTKLKNRCEKFVINHAKKKHTWIHHVNSNVSLVCKKWYLSSCHNTMWGLPTIMLYLHLTRFSVSFKSFDSNDLNKMISTYYSSRTEVEEIRKKLQVLCDYLLPSKDIFMDTIVHINNKQFTLDHLNQFSSKLTSVITKRADAMKNTVQATMESIDKKITDTTNTITEKLEQHIAQHKLSNTILGHDIKEDAPVMLEDVTELEDNDQVLLADEIIVEETQTLNEKVKTPDDFDIIPSSEEIGQDLMNNSNRRKSLRNSNKNALKNVSFRNLINDDGMEDMTDDPSTLLSSQQSLKPKKRRGKKRNSNPTNDFESSGTNLNIFSKRYRFFKDTFIEMKKIQQFEFERIRALNYTDQRHPPPFSEKLKFVLRNTFPEILSILVSTLFLLTALVTCIAMMSAPSYYIPGITFWIWSLMFYCTTWTIVWVYGLILQRRITSALNPKMNTHLDEERQRLTNAPQQMSELEEVFHWIKGWLTSQAPPRELSEEASIGLAVDVDQSIFYKKRLAMKLADHSLFYHLVGILFVIPIMIITLLDYLMIHYELTGWFGVFAIPSFIYFVSTIITGVLFVIAIWDSIIYLFRKYISYDLTERMRKQLRVVSIRNWPFLLTYGASMTFFIFWFCVGFSAYLDEHDDREAAVRLTFTNFGYTFIPLYIAEGLTVGAYIFALIMRSAFYKSWFWRASALCVSCAISQICISFLAPTSAGVLCFLTLIIPIFMIFIMVALPQLRFIHKVGSRFAYILN